MLKDCEREWCRERAVSRADETGLLLLNLVEMRRIRPGIVGFGVRCCLEGVVIDGAKGCVCWYGLHLKKGRKGV